MLGSSSDPVDQSAMISSSGHLSTGMKAVIGVGSAMGALLLACLGFVLYHRRRKRQRLQHRGLKAHIRHHHGFSDHTDAPTPLISPVHSASGGLSTLTPPARLRDRKLLPSLFKPGGTRSASPPLTSLSPPRTPTRTPAPPGSREFTFPSSPNCSPTTTKLLPRHERSAKVYAVSVPPAAGPRGSLSSYAASGSTTANSSLRNAMAPPSTSRATTTTTTTTTTYTTPAAAAASGPVGTPPPSPPRPPRPHETALEIPDLVSPVSPVGPPPNRALPVPPTSPTSVSGGRHGGGVGADDDDAQDLHALTCEYARETRESWGSWTTGGGGPPARAGRAPRAGSGESERSVSGPPPLLREEDMESLGGGY